MLSCVLCLVSFDVILPEMNKCDVVCIRKQRFRVCIREEPEKGELSGWQCTFADKL